MLKRESGTLKFLTASQIFNIVFVTISFAFIIHEANLVSAQTWYNTLTGQLEYGPLNPSTNPWIVPYTGSVPPPVPPSVPIPPGTTPPPTPNEGIIEGLFGRNPFGIETGFFASLTSGLIWGGVAYGVRYLAGSLLGLSDSQSETLGEALGIGVEENT